jgi:L-lactate dehydrogenase complex protein LldF
MPDKFHTQIRTALSNENLQAALDANAERRILARTQAYASLPEDFQVLRQRAHAVRLQTIDQLEKYLEEFIRNVQDNGIIVHRAADAVEATRIVLDIARQNSAHLIAKSKSMVSEEIHLNQALESAGMQVVETDLGEYIVQLRHEPPAHIITPAVHLRRKDVGELFARELGIPYTEDVPTLTATARQVLRQVFLDADVGITGVNFGVAESGTLCIITNEGNGRMVTSLPHTHIALMGIERLVPSLTDLALMLELLPRSATGQKITVYTNLIHSPRRLGETDGALERHLVMVDNGRTHIKDSPLKEILFCIRCGACLNACPVFREIGGHAYVSRRGKQSAYQGPVGSVLAPGLFGVVEFGQLARASSLCGACKEACPVDIDLPKLLLRVRAGGMSIDMHHTPLNVPTTLALSIKLFNFIAVRSKMFAVSQKIAAIISSLLFHHQPWLRLPAFTRWGLSRDLPSPASQSFSNRWATGLVKNSSMSEPFRSRTQAAAQIAANPVQHQGYGYARFTRELEELGVVCTPCQRSQLTSQIADVLLNQNIQTIQSWAPTSLPAGLLDELQKSGIQIVYLPDPEVKAGLTGAIAGVAASGSLLLPAAPGQPLTASLLPSLHLVVVSSSRIYDHLDQVFILPEVKASSSTVLVTGPSRTADIEMTLSIGVHGPEELRVFCLVD